MVSIRLEIPESLHHRLRELAEREGVSIERFINVAIAEKLSRHEAEDYFSKRSERGSRRKYDAALGRVRNDAPCPGDELNTD